jgi:hypothetical protein
VSPLLANCVIILIPEGHSIVLPKTEWVRLSLTFTTITSNFSLTVTSVFTVVCYRSDPASPHAGFSISSPDTSEASGVAKSLNSFPNKPSLASNRYCSS